ncbi:MAG: hypothetical protein ACWGMZ_06715 [Thermoguttaceae bacterium]
MAELIISVSGLRGIVGETLTAEVAAGYARAFAAILPPGDIFIGRDSRPSGRMLSEAIQAGLQSLGRDTIDGGILSTPTVGLQVRACDAVGGIQITASHNPSPYNGMKLFSTTGRVIPAVEGQKVLDIFRAAKGDSPIFATTRCVVPAKNRDSPPKPVFVWKKQDVLD